MPMLFGIAWGQQDPRGSHVGPMNFAIWAVLFYMDVITYPCPNWHAGLANLY